MFRIHVGKEGASRFLTQSLESATSPFKQGSSGGDCASVTAADFEASRSRLKAEGFPLAPLIEAVMAVRFQGGLSADETRSVSQALLSAYSVVGEAKEQNIIYDADAETVQLQGARSVYRLEAKDETEIALVRPDGISVSQLPPYRSWELLFDRFARDWEIVERVIGPRVVDRLAVRSINRIDVPMIDEQANYEEYLAAHIRLPDGAPPVNDFYLRFALEVPEISAVATVQSAVMKPAIEGKASFALDIDLAREEELPAERSAVLACLQMFRAPKNALYRQFLTPKALEEFA